VTSLGPGSSAVTWAGRKVADWIGHQPPPDITAQVREQLPHADPGWLQHANEIRGQIRYDIDDDGRAPLDQDALGQLAELSERMRPWDAAMTIFGGSE
jgi:hypothetical protein